MYIQAGLQMEHWEGMQMFGYVDCSDHHNRIHQAFKAAQVEIIYLHISKGEGSCFKSCFDHE